jgi:hypothetical protein
MVWHSLLGCARRRASECFGGTSSRPKSDSVMGGVCPSETRAVGDVSVRQGEL